MRRLAVLTFLLVSACAMPPTPSERVTNAARELNDATRFGRMELALGHTHAGARRHFTERRASWGRAVRVVDFELTGLAMPDQEHAEVLVDIAWVRMDDSTLRSTRVAQTWRGTIDDDGWKLVRERRVGGDLGLFGEPVANVEPEHPVHQDVQFPSKTIR